MALKIPALLSRFRAFSAAFGYMPVDTYQMLYDNAHAFEYICLVVVASE